MVHILSVYFAALGISHAYCHLWPALLYTGFSTPSHTTRYSWGKKLLNTNCVIGFSLQLLFEMVHILRRYERDMIENLHRFSFNIYTYIHTYIHTYIYTYTS